MVLYLRAQGLEEGDEYPLMVSSGAWLTLVLYSKHDILSYWLPVQQRQIELDLAMLELKSLHGLAPPHDDNLWTSQLCSAAVPTCLLPRMSTGFGGQVLCVFRYTDLKRTSSISAAVDVTVEHFERQLKMHFFRLYWSA